MPVYSNSNGQSSRINLSTSTLDSVALSTVLYQKTWCIPQDVIYTITPTTQPNVNWNVVNGDLAYTIAEFTLAETCADLVWTYSFYGDVLLNGIPDVSHPFTISGNTISAIVNNALIGNVYSITLKGMIPNQ